MYEGTKRYHDRNGANGDAVRKLVWLAKHTEGIDEEEDRYVADHYADGEGRAFFHQAFDPYAKRGLKRLDECVHEIKSCYAFLWAELDCLTTDRAVAAYRDEAGRYGITLPEDETGIQGLADLLDIWAVIS